MKKLIKFLIIIIVTFIIIVLHSRFISTKGLKVKEYKINTDIIDEYHGLKIVHLSDLNYGSTVNEKDLIKIVNKINLINPDIVVFTGNLFSVNKDKDLVIKQLKNINSKLGKYAISGDKDINNNEFNNILKESNFINLDNSYKLIYNKSNNPIIISGMKEYNIKEELKNDIIYSILLIHEPDKIDSLDLDKYNLILAGHSLNGQINIPYIKNYLLPDNAKKYYDNYYKLNNTDLYISSGIGTNKYKFRLFNKPSINFYRIIKNS